MNDSIRRFLIRLSRVSRKLFFEHLDLSLPDVSDKKPREKDKTLIDSLVQSNPRVRVAAEAISTHVLLLSNKGDFAERALRAVSLNNTPLVEILESDRSLEERIFLVWLKDNQLLDRARNLAMSFHQKDGRFHSGFRVIGGNPLEPNLESTIKDIQRIVQSQQGGRNVSVDDFTYKNECSGQLIYHLAIYLETPASWVMTFEDSKDRPIPILRRDAKELAIDYNQQTGSLDLAGKGIGGHRNIVKIAETFVHSAMTASELTEVALDEWQLDQFLLDRPVELKAPDGYSEVKVSEMVLYSQIIKGSKTTIRAGEGQSVYERMYDLGISEEKRSFEKIYALTFTLKVIPSANNDLERIVRVTISGKNARSFEGATFDDRVVIENWLKKAPFI